MHGAMKEGVKEVTHRHIRARMNVVTVTKGHLCLANPVCEKSFAMYAHESKGFCCSNGISEVSMLMFLCK